MAVSGFRGGPRIRHRGAASLLPEISVGVTPGKSPGDRREGTVKLRL
jgi:hypothetical protein